MIDVSVLSETETRTARPALCAVLADCVADGASLGFMSPYSAGDAVTFWDGVSEAVRDNATVLIVARYEGEIAGTVQLGVKMMPNQTHRADVKKLLVHRRARGLGLGRALMGFAEEEAMRRGKTVLVLDTATGSPAEAIYAKLGWQRVGVIPDYARMPDGPFCGSTFFYKHLPTV